MDKIEVRCGKCESKLELSIPHLQKLFAREFIHPIKCPGCETEVPDALRKILMNLSIDKKLMDGWDVGTHFIPNE